MKAYGRGLRISSKTSVIVCRAISGKTLEKGKKLLEGLADQRIDLQGRYYSKVSGQLLSLLKASEQNAEFKGLDTSRLVIHASAHKGFTYYRPRRFKMRRTQIKATNIQIVLKET